MSAKSIAALSAIVLSFACLSHASASVPSDILDRWDVSPASLNSLAEPQRRHVEIELVALEAERQKAVSILKSLTGNSWRRYVDAKERPTAEGLRLIAPRYAASGSPALPASQASALSSLERWSQLPRPISEAGLANLFDASASSKENPVLKNAAIPDSAAKLAQVKPSAKTPNSPQSAISAVAVNDSSGLNRTEVFAVEWIRTEADVRRALEKARGLGIKVSVAGRQHSQGGQSLGKGNLILDVKGFNGMSFDPKTGLLTAGSGATWAQIQKYLDPLGRAVKVMQSDNIFTVGGTLSVNAHGWQIRSGPVASTVRDFRLMLPSGEIKICSRTQNRDLFRAALGGYGLIGVILDARIETQANALYTLKSWKFPAAEFIDRFQRHVDANPAAQLAYGRLSIDNGHMLTEASLHVYETASAQPDPLPPMEGDQWIGLARAVFKASRRSEHIKRARWILENSAVNWIQARKPMTRNTAMNHTAQITDINDAHQSAILQEYFIPRERFNEFREGLARTVQAEKQNLLNVTLRDVRRDPDSLMAFARQDSIAFVLFFSQPATEEGEESMRRATRKLIESAAAVNGTFYLPYRLHYTPQQFRRAYPQAAEFLQLKKRVDPESLLSNDFYRYISSTPL